MNKSFPKNFQQLSLKLDNIFNFNNILIVNTYSTGLFLDNFFLKQDRITRIKYKPDEFDDFLNIIEKLDKTFDLICLDPWHEYKESINSLTVLLKLLNKNGILISHDCNPPNFVCTNHKYQKGEWCGVTYAAFVEIIYNNPNLYYAVIDNDYGLGIISKNKIAYFQKNTNNEKQANFLNLFHENKYEDAYNYFKDNIFEIVNLIN
jgi:hypothetical protein